MDAVLLFDADSAIFASCVCKREDTEDGKGFIYELEEAAHKFDEKVLNIINILESEYSFDIVHTLHFLESHGNFRYGFNKSYKANRKDRELPPLLNPLKDWIKNNYNNDIFSTFDSINVETDDSIAATYRKWHINDFGVQLIVASPDKDLKTIPCLHFDTYWSRMELSSITEVDAYRNLMTQMIVGDAADNVSGIAKYGEKKAKKLLEALTSKFSLLKSVWSLYKITYGRNAKLEFYKAYYSLKLNDSHIATPNLDEILMFKNP